MESESDSMHESEDEGKAKCEHLAKRQRCAYGGCQFGDVPHISTEYRLAYGLPTSSSASHPFMPQLRMLLSF
eukprot:3067801-Prymnesium_polylepis.1